MMEINKDLSTDRFKVYHVGNGWEFKYSVYDTLTGLEEKFYHMQSVKDYINNQSEKI